MKALIRPAIVMAILIMALNVSAQPPQGRGGRQQMTSEERAKQRVEQLKKDLVLNEEQEKQVYDLQLKMAASMEAIRVQSDREKMMSEMEKLRKEESAAMEKILTKEQFEKWQKQQTERRGDMGGRGQGRQGRQGGQDRRQ